MTGPLLHGRQTCSLIPVGVELDLTAPRHRARRAEDPPTMWAPPGGKHRRTVRARRGDGPAALPEGWEWTTDDQPAPRLLGPPCPCLCHIVPGVSHIAPCCHPVPS